MTSEFIRNLLYPLGLLATCFFTLRFFIQWLQSEKKKESTVTKSFWIFSITGNALMALHALIQLQAPLCLIQCLNGIIAWRNLNLMKIKPLSFRKTLALMAATILLASLLFVSQGLVFHSLAWMREPSFLLPSGKDVPLSIYWHLLGFASMLLFASRFWIQWWSAEKNKKSTLGKSFWWISLCGALFSLLYFIRLHDLVNILSYSVGLIPYIRNLFLMKKKKMEDVSSREKSIFIFAGEQSGDVLGGKLVEALKKQNSSIALWGVGGEHMQKAGLALFSSISKFHVMGFIEVLKALPRLYRQFRIIKREILKKNPLACIFIDYPDFNMKMAAALRKSGYKGRLIHYVCPSVWAWRRNRIYEMAKRLDLLISIFPFEKKYFNQTSLQVAYVGHPLVASINRHDYVPDWKEKSGILLDKPILALFPGSRKGEIEKNLPLQLEAIKPLEKDFHIAISCARKDLENLIRKHVGNRAIVPHEFRYELMKEAKGALATSGTVVLELGLHATPTVATYRIGLFNYVLGRYVFKILLPFYTLVNIISEREVFPEFIHKDVDPQDVSLSIKKLLENRESCISACKKLKSLLEEADASAKAAKAIQEIL